MTNIERLKSKSTKEFSKAIQNLQDTTSPFRSYFDMVSWLDSEDNDVTHFIKAQCKGTLIPSEAELQVKCKNISDKVSYIKTHSKEVLVLESTQIYGQSYYTIFDAESRHIQKVSSQCLTLKK